MSAADDRPTLRNLGTVLGAPESGLRYMRRRRRVGTADHNGDPLDGLANLFNIALVLAVGLLLAILTAAGLTGLLTNESMTIVINPGTPEMQVIVKEGTTIGKLDTQAGEEVSGTGTLLGSFYQLTDGTVVYVPAGQTMPADAVPLPGATTAPEGTVTPTPYPTAPSTDAPTPYPTTAPPATPTPGVTATPTPGVTLTPDTEVESRGTL
jgi:hypothetical protein